MSDLLNKASLVMIPSGYKEDVVYSAVPSDGSGDLALTRASNGTRVNSAGLVEVCPWNLAEQSETFNVSPWTNYGTGTITANATTAPNGTTTADLFVPNTTNYTHAVEQNIGTTSGVITMSVYAKAAGYNWLVLNAYVGGAKYTYFDLQNGVIGTTASGVTASIENVGNGWFKLICTLTGGASTYFSIISATANNTSSFAGNGTSGTYLWGAQLNIGSTAKPYFPTTDRLNVPRLTYQNGGGGCPSLLLEKQSTNLFQYSEQFDNAYWSKLGTVTPTITANATTSPDGTANADLLAGGGGAGQRVQRTMSVSLLTAYSVSIYVKANTSTTAQLNIYDGVTDRGGDITFSTGAVTTYGTGVTASSTNVGNGWYRFTINYTSFATISVNIQFGVSGSTSYYLWGAQLEASSYATSYIPTTSASATRVADACSKTGISSLIGQTEGVLFADVILPSTNDSGRVLVISGGSNRVGITLSGTTAGFFIVTGGGGVIFSSVAAVTGPNFKMALAYKSGASTLYVNGVSILSTTGAFSFNATVDTIYLGQSELTPGTGQNGQRQSEALLFKNALTSSELISLTTL